MADYTPSLDVVEDYAPISDRRKTYRTMGLVCFVIAFGIASIRLALTFFLRFVSLDDIVVSTIFSFVGQVGINVIAVWLLMKFCLKLNIRQVASFSNFRKTKWYNYVLALVLGFVNFFVTIGLSTIWMVILIMLGYTSTSSGSSIAEFSAFIFILQIFITAVLPAFCEEFAIRGGLFTTLKGSLSGTKFILISGLIFGLFHQNITQVFYTGVMGCMFAFLLLKTRSIWPCIILHFTNNFLSVYIDYASSLGWFGGDLYTVIGITAQNNILLLAGSWLLFVAGVIGLLYLISFLNKTKNLEKQKELILNSGFDHTNKRLILVGQENKALVKELGMDNLVYGNTLQESLFKPSLRDNVFYIGAGVCCALYTIFTFVYGLMV